MTMPTDDFRLLSLLLHYPDDALLGHLEDIEAMAQTRCSPPVRTAVEAFAGYCRAHSPIQLQEKYTAAFDMNPAATLNLTYHAYGDNEKRAAAMARLNQVYEACGFEPATGELPDYLPLMLEFLSLCPDSPHLDGVWEVFCGLEKVLEPLKHSAPEYAGLLQALVATKRN
jgi:nitrate reductase delta subunit